MKRLFKPAGALKLQSAVCDQDPDWDQSSPQDYLCQEKHEKKTHSVKQLFIRKRLSKLDCKM